MQSLEQLSTGPPTVQNIPSCFSALSHLPHTTSLMLSSSPVSTSPELRLYKRMLAQAANDSLPSSSRTLNLRDFEDIAIVIDDVDNAGHDHLIISPIRSPGHRHSVMRPDQSPCVDPRLAMDTTPTQDTSLVDQEARSWLKACEQTPFLSDAWLTNLTKDYYTKARQRIWERQLAEAKLIHLEKQRLLVHQARLANLEQRLACLLLTPPVLVDPYLVPKPIPIELPYRPRKLTTIEPALPQLTDEQLAQVEIALRVGSPDSVVTENFQLSVTRRELITLTGTSWLSDMVINFYLQLLYHRSQRASSHPSTVSLPRIAVLSTFFYAKLSSNNGGFAGVRRWSRQLNLLDQDLILIPIHDRGMHWCLSCIDLKAKTITYYDSMGSKNDKCLKNLMSYLKNECEDKKGHPLPDLESWHLINTEDSVPQQENGSDCGVFLCTYGEFLSRNARFTFSQKDMPGIRKRMMYEILTQQLLTTSFKMHP